MSARDEVPTVKVVLQRQRPTRGEQRNARTEVIGWLIVAACVAALTVAYAVFHARHGR